ncbi:hypothetical protein M0812_26758 [Anaeramoeba flamelloides]|uniref:Serine aminopeptidase S33 domain-containing protein n=1 Tax=Anaeramoeba flamelloides TaxID=1746091 RepID=A0AAV7YBJ8_9EUKA|nr:hypothetical protein M0812_26758 [Anaeramoeba flamelloides]
MGPLVSKIVFRPPKRITLKHKEKVIWTKTKNNLKVPIFRFTPEDEYEEDFRLVRMRGMTSTSDTDSFCNRSWSLTSPDEDTIKKQGKGLSKKKGTKKNEFQLTETEEESWSEHEEDKKKYSKTNSIDQKFKLQEYTQTESSKNEKEKGQLPFQNRKRMTIIFSHGNGESIYELDRFATRLAHKTNCNVCLFEYPGYPQTKGKRRETNCYQSAEAVYLWLVNQQNVDPSEIIWFGHSLGSAVVLEIASRHPCAGVLLVSPILSCFRVVFKFNVNLPYDIFVNVKKAPNVKVPVMVVHGTQDKVVPVKHGEMLFKLFPNQFDCIWIKNAGHNNIESRYRIRFYREINRLIDFLIPENQKKIKEEKSKTIRKSRKEGLKSFKKKGRGKRYYQTQSKKNKQKQKEEEKQKQEKDKLKKIERQKDRYRKRYSNFQKKKPNNNKFKQWTLKYGANLDLTSSSSSESVFDFDYNIFKEKQQIQKYKQHLKQMLKNKTNQKKQTLQKLNTYNKNLKTHQRQHQSKRTLPKKKYPQYSQTKQTNTIKSYHGKKQKQKIKNKNINKNHHNQRYSLQKKKSNPKKKNSKNTIL